MRLINRFLAPLIALAILAATIIFAVECFADLFGASPVIFGWHGLYRAGKRDTWNSDGVRATLVLIGSAGLLLLLAQLAPRRPHRLRVKTDADHVDAGVSRSAVRTMLIDAATDIDGVDSAKATLKRRRAKVIVKTRFGAQDGADALRPAITAAVDERLASLQLARRVTAKVRVTAGRA